jgi:hypothetical protein
MAPFRDHFAVEVDQLLEEPDILKKLRAARPGGQDILVVGDGSAGDVGEFLFHFFPFRGKKRL